MDEEQNWDGMEGGDSVCVATECGIGRMAKVNPESELQVFTAKPQVAPR
jgi:hypothetical protein